MKSFSRRNFLKTGLAVLPVPFAATAFGNAIKKHKPLLAFSTLGCPDWTYSQILDFAQLNGPRAGGKIPVNPNYVVRHDGKRWVFRNYAGKEFTYYEP